MSYPVLNDYDKNKNNIIEDITYRKEFFSFGQKKKVYENTYIDNIISKNKKLILNSYQNFINNFININTPYTRLLLIHGTGSGKTITALNISNEFINYYKKVDINLGKIFILGFTKNIFKRELLRPEFGIISKEELDELIKVKQLVSENNLPRDINYLKELKSRFNRRISKQNIEFYGYREFVNKLFILNDLDTKLTDLSEVEILQYLKNNTIKLNKDLLHSFKNSLLICDEIHNVYNSLSPNNWGISIQIVLDFHSQNGNTLRSLFLSATPINNHYIEVVNMLNLLSDFDKKIHKYELFDKNNIFLPNSFNIIQNLSLNKISYIRDINTEFYPSKQFIGEKIQGIEYLKFIKCQMSPLHLNTYKSLSKFQQENNITDEKKTINSVEFNIKNRYPITLPLEQIYINDYVLPNPDNDKIGLFKSSDINDKIRNSTQEWKDKNQIKFFNKKDGMANYEITGNFMLEDNIKNYSTKYFKLLLLIKDMVKNKKGKIFIYHNFVNNSGVIFIQEMLKINGYLDKSSTSTSNTICTICGKIRKLHEEAPKSFDHDFKPIRFIMIHSEIQKNIIENDLDMFNLPSNASGDNIKIIIGSRSIKESFDLKSIRNVIITSCPDNISTLIQIIGRAVRKNSHIDLPKNENNVDIILLVNSIHNDYNKIEDLSYEELKYKNKIDIYKKIQKIENIFIKNSIDSLVNKNIYINNLDDELFPNKIIYDKNSVELYDHKINISSFVPFHIRKEIDTVKYIIKRIFLEVSNIMDYQTLFTYVLNPPFHVELMTNKILESSFIIALDFLVYKKDNIELVNLESTNLADNLFDYSNKIIIDFNKNKKIITYVNKYYILTDYNKDDYIYISVDEPFRKTIDIPERKFLLSDYINKSNIINNYDELKEFILEKYKNTNFKQILTFLYDYEPSFHKRLVEDIIKYFYDLYTGKIKKIESIHQVYFNLLYYYNKFNLIIFCNELDEESYIVYKNIVSKSDDNNIQNIIMSSLEEELITSSDNIQDKQELDDKKYNSYRYFLNLSDNFLENKDGKKILDILLPVGHIIEDIPILYSEENGWSNVNINYNQDINYIENDIIVGYNSKEKNSTEIKFKLRPSAKKNINKDSRKIFTGVVCMTKDKKNLVNIIQKLDPEFVFNKKSKIELCNIIKRKLILKEIDARKKNNNIKYYYHLLE